MQAPQPTISVVVCSYNGEDAIPTVLKALSEQTLPHSEYEVVVVDDGSRDRTADVAEAGGAIVIRQPENRGVGAARNAGFRRASAPVVAYTDDDCVPAPDWLERMRAAFDDASIAAVAGHTEPTATDSVVLRYLDVRNPLAPLPKAIGADRPLLGRLRDYLRGVLSVECELPEGVELYSGPTANMAFRRSLLEDLGGFDDALGGAEDEDLCRRAIEGGARILYRPEAVVRHAYDRGLGDTLRRARYYGNTTAVMAAKHDGVGLIVYPFPLAAGVVLGAALVTRRPALLAAAAALPLALYAGWPLLALRRRSAEPLAYPYLQLAEEAMAMAGEYAGMRDGRVAASVTQRN